MCNCQNNNRCSQPMPCTQPNCACPVLISSDCVNNVTEDLVCSNILKGQTLTEVLIQLDAYICAKFGSLENFLSITNLGVGAKIYKGDTLLGKKQLRTLKSSDNSVVIIEGDNEIDLSASGLWAAGTGENSVIVANSSCIARGSFSLAEGYSTQANGESSHAGGNETIATGLYSFVHGDNSTAVSDNTIVLGANIIGTDPDKTYVDGLNIKTVPSGTSVNNLGIDTSGNVVIGTASAAPYKVYTALITQSGTAAPTVVVLENTLSGSIVWTRLTSGIYTGTLVGAFVANKTFCVISAHSNSWIASLARTDNDNVSVQTALQSTNASQDSGLAFTAIEIRVYN